MLESSAAASDAFRPLLDTYRAFGLVAQTILYLGDESARFVVEEPADSYRASSTSGASTT